MFMSARSRFAAIASAAALILALQTFAYLPSSAQQSGCATFKETGKAVCGKFLAYWQSHGALPQQGFPISEEMQEVSDLDGKTYKVQYFERAVFELHPENAGTRYEVLLSQLGTYQLKRKYEKGGQQTEQRKVFEGNNWRMDINTKAAIIKPLNEAEWNKIAPTFPSKYELIIVLDFKALEAKAKELGLQTYELNFYDIVAKGLDGNNIVIGKCWMSGEGYKAGPAMMYLDTDIASKVSKQDLRRSLATISTLYLYNSYEEALQSYVRISRMIEENLHVDYP